MASVLVYSLAEVQLLSEETSHGSVFASKENSQFLWAVHVQRFCSF